jgi:hypothetical protein
MRNYLVPSVPSHSGIKIQQKRQNSISQQPNVQLFSNLVGILFVSLFISGENLKALSFIVFEMSLKTAVVQPNTWKLKFQTL